MGRAPCCDKANVKRGPWSPEEDATLKRYVETHGTGGNWIALPQKAGLRRCGKSCRLRWLNYLRPDIKHGNFTEDEDRVIWTLYSQMGSRWSIIASHLSGRTDNDVKNYWNTRLKKKLFGGKLGFTSKSNQFPTSSPSSVLDSTAPSVLPKSEPFDLHFSASQNQISSSMLPAVLGDIDTQSLRLDPNQFAHTEHVLASDFGTNLKTISSPIVTSSQEGSSSVSESNNSQAGMDNRALSLPSNVSVEDSGILMEYFSFGNPYQSLNNGVWFQEKASTHDEVQVHVPLICYPNLADSSYADIKPQGLVNQSVINQY